MSYIKERQAWEEHLYDVHNSQRNQPKIKSKSGTEIHRSCSLLLIELVEISSLHLKHINEREKNYMKNFV